jgi:hypothetical protein
MYTLVNVYGLGSFGKFYDLESAENYLFSLDDWIDWMVEKI